MNVNELFEQSPPIVIVGLAVVGLLLVLKGKTRKKQYRPKGKIGGDFKPILFLNTKAEQNFFNQLIRKTNDTHYIAAKVRLADLCLPKNGDITSFNKIARKHVDFVVIERATSRVLCCIELDDRSHQRNDSIRRDKEKDYALKKAGITLHRVKAGRNYTTQINDIFGAEATPKKTVWTKPPATALSNCPRCNSTEVEKVILKWPNSGKFYWHCDNCTFNSDPMECS